ncbi:MAG: DUF927 domain-containing protein, partial [Thiomonas sp.]|nr:DUF927 domain-containing protein [Thiomonas sp.]
MQGTLSIDEIRAALACIPPDLPREEWARIAMALKSELGAAGFDLFNAWSVPGDTYDAKAVRDTWRSIKAGGRVTVGTLLHTAQQHGFKRSEPAAPPSPEARKAQAAERAARDQQEQAAREAAQATAAQEAQRRFSAASDTGASPYLDRKAVSAHGARFTPDGALLVPLRSLQGELRNVQTIASDGSKRYLRAAQKTGLLHWIGSPEGAPVLILCEGFATAASLHEATARPAVCCLDASNLPHVARELRSHYGPGVLLLLAGDNDRETEARTGKNPGRTAAETAAREVGGFVALPDAPEGQNVDFNDWAASAGLEAVKAHLEAAIAQALAQPAAKPEAPAEAPAQSSKAAAPEHDRFRLDSAGVWFTELDGEGRPKPPLWVCSRLEVTALTRDADGREWGLLLEFDDPSGMPRQWAAPAKMLAADGAEFRGVLLSLGLRISTAPRARQLLATYVQTRRPEALARCVDRVGWHPGGVYVLPDEVIGQSSERLIFQAETATENTLRQRGTLDQWRSRVACYAVGNSRLAFAISTAFAGMVLRPSGEGGGGFHLVGASSSGKSTALRLAASTYGAAAYAQNWRSTSNAIEGTAAAHCDRTLILDEIAQVDAREIGECSYLLSNGLG